MWNQPNGDLGISIEVLILDVFHITILKSEQLHNGFFIRRLRHLHDLFL